MTGESIASMQKDLRKSVKNQNDPKFAGICTSFEENNELKAEVQMYLKKWWPHTPI